jgi:hypothetical protein
MSDVNRYNSCAQFTPLRARYSFGLEYDPHDLIPIVQPKLFRFTGDDSDTGIVDAYFDNEEHAHIANGKDNYLVNQDDTWFTTEHDTRYTDEYEMSHGDNMENILGAFVYFRLRASNRHVDEIRSFKRLGHALQVQRSWAGFVHAIGVLKKCPWWTRIWVLQEVVLARKATVIYSNVSVPWDMLTDAVNKSWMHDQVCCKNIMEQRPGPETNLLTEYKATTVSDMEAVRLGLGSDAMTLLQIMVQSVGRDATDPRDQVYGLLGLVTNWYKKPPLVPDYNRTIQEILMQAQYIEVQGSSGVNGLIGDPRFDIPGLPSWVTQLSSTRQRPAAGLSRYQRAALFRAAGDTRGNARRVDNNLSVNCFNPFDTVQSIASASIGPWMFKDVCAWRRAAEVVLEWRKLCEEQSRNHISPEGFIRTMFNDCMILHPKKQYEEIQKNAIVKTTCRRLHGPEISSMFGEWWNWVQCRATVNDDGTYDHVELLASNSNNITLCCQSFIGRRHTENSFSRQPGAWDSGLSRYSQVMRLSSFVAARYLSP